MLELVVLIRNAVMAVLMAWAGLTEFDAKPVELPPLESEASAPLQPVSPPDSRIQRATDTLRLQAARMLRNS